MKPFEINVKIDCSDRLETLVKSIFFPQHSTTNAAAPAVTEHGNAVTDPEAKRQEDLKHIDALLEKHKHRTSHLEENMPVETEASLKKAASEAGKREEKHEDITDAQIRSAIKSCRTRLSKDIPDPDLETRVREITTTLQAEVRKYGVAKSVEIPQEHRAAFIKFCEELKLETEDVPF